MVTAHCMASAGSWKASRKESPSVAISYPQNLRSAPGCHAPAARLHAVLLCTWTAHCSTLCKCLSRTVIAAMPEPANIPHKQMHKRVTAWAGYSHA